MVFSSFLFLFVFLPIFLGCYFLTPYRWKNLTALIGSYLFYAWGAPTIVLLFFFSCLVDYILSKGLARQNYPGRRKWIVVCSMCLNLGALFYYKYSNFAIGEFNRLLNTWDVTSLHWSHVALPIGISFFTFQKISYIIDVYRRTVPPAESFIDYALYIALFPQLIAGPIVCYADIRDQLKNRRHNIGQVFEGLSRFCWGLGKKVLIADAMGNVADNVFNLSTSQLSTGFAWLGVVCYAYQIYFDFSGYSDMAIGLSRIMGFRLKENFNQPYIAQSITEFWRRWHISLSRFMRDYLYIPLGGNRVSTSRMYVNLWIVFILSGLWHGAQWTFVLWGVYHGFFLVLDKLFWLKYSQVLGRFGRTLLTFLIVLFGWTLFRSSTLTECADYMLRLVDFIHYGSASKHVLQGQVIHNAGVFIFCIATLISFAPSVITLGQFQLRARGWLSEFQFYCLRFIGSVACLVLAALTMATADFSPFIYFRF